MRPGVRCWLGGRDSNPDTVVQSHVSYRWTTSHQPAGSRRETLSISTSPAARQSAAPRLRCARAIVRGRRTSAPRRVPGSPTGPSPRRARRESATRPSHRAPRPPRAAPSRSTRRSNVGSVGKRRVERRQMLGHAGDARDASSTAAGSYSISSVKKNRPCSTKSPSRFDARLEQLEHREEPRVPIAPETPSSQRPAASNDGFTRAASSSGASRAMCCWLNQSSFSGLKTALPPLMPSSANAATSSSRVNSSRSPAPGDQPSSARKFTIASGRMPCALVLHHRRRAVALAQPLLVGTENQRHVRELRHRRAERLIQQHLLRRVRDVIVAAHHVRDRHLDVVRHDRQVIRRMAVGAEDDEVLDVGAVELDRPVDEIVEPQCVSRPSEP